MIFPRQPDNEYGWVITPEFLEKVRDEISIGCFDEISIAHLEHIFLWVEVYTLDVLSYALEDTLACVEDDGSVTLTPTQVAKLKQLFRKED